MEAIYLVVKNHVGNHISVLPVSGDLQNWIVGALGRRLSFCGTAVVL